MITMLSLLMSVRFGGTRKHRKKHLMNFGAKKTLCGGNFKEIYRIYPAWKSDILCDKCELVFNTWSKYDKLDAKYFVKVT